MLEEMGAVLSAVREGVPLAEQDLSVFAPMGLVAGALAVATVLIVAMRRIGQRKVTRTASRSRAKLDASDLRALRRSR